MNNDEDLNIDHFQVVHRDMRMLSEVSSLVCHVAQCIQCTTTYKYIPRIST